MATYAKRLAILQVPLKFANYEGSVKLANKWRSANDMKRTKAFHVTEATQSISCPVCGFTQLHPASSNANFDTT